MELRVDVDLSGPIPRGEAPAILDSYRQNALDEVAREGQNRVVGRLAQVIRNPTPYYWTQVTTRNDGDDRVIHDGGVVYGPWLEGVSERNRTTRFKGYHTFRIIGQELQRSAPDIAERALPPYLKKLEGD